MHRLIRYTDDQFAALKRKLQDESRQECLPHCKLPPCCDKPECTVAFEKGNGFYYMLISGGITCSKKGNNTTVLQFKQLLQNGSILFLDYNDLKTFLKNLTVLY